MNFEDILDDLFFLYHITKISALVIWNNHILVICRMNSIISNNKLGAISLYEITNFAVMI
jgi:hypothetical protein